MAALSQSPGCLEGRTPIAIPPPPEPPGEGPAASAGPAGDGPTTSPEPGAPLGEAPPVRIEVVPTPEPGSVPTVRIVSPRGGTAVDTEALAAPIQVETAGFDPREHQLVAILDDAPTPLETPERLPSLTSLGLVPGGAEHRLAVCVTDREGRALRPSRGPTPASSVSFFVGESAIAASPAKSRREVHGVPFTHSGEALVVDYCAIGDALDGVGVELSVSPPDGRVYRATSPSRAPFLVRGLPVGRTKLRLRLVDAAGRQLDDTQPVERVVEVP